MGPIHRRAPTDSQFDAELEDLARSCVRTTRRHIVQAEELRREYSTAHRTVRDSRIDLRRAEVECGE